LFFTILHCVERADNEIVSVVDFLVNNFCLFYVRGGISRGMAKGRKVGGKWAESREWVR